MSELRGNPTKILEAIDDFSYQQDFLISVGPQKARILKDLIDAKSPKVLVELGGYLGYSAILFADALRNKLPPGTPFRVWSIEADPLFASIAMNLIDLAGLSDVVKVVTGKAGDTLKRLQAEGAIATIDVLFLDHVEKLYEADFKLAMSLGLLKPGAEAWADNALRPGAPEYVAYVRSQPRLESKGLKALIMPGEFEDEIEFTKILE